MDFFDSENFNAEEIAEEREHLSRTLSLMREQIELLENDGFAYRTVDIYDEQDIEEYRTDKFRHDERKLTVKILRAALGTPYFARMKLRQTGGAIIDDTPSMTRARQLSQGGDLPVDADIYVGANVVFYKDRIIVYSHNSPLGNRVYDRFEDGVIEYGGYKYEVIFRRKFDIRGGELKAVFQDYSKDGGGVVYDKFLAHMLAVKRGDKRLTDIIPTIQANQNAIITRPADENSVVCGCAGCGKTMILLQRLEYLSFNKKLDLDRAVVIAPSERYIEHIQPVVDDLMIGAARRLTMPELYRELILSLRGIKASARRALGVPLTDDEALSPSVVAECYSDSVKRKLIAALKPAKQSYAARLAIYREKLRAYEAELAWARGAHVSASAEKPSAPVVAVDLARLPMIPDLGAALSKAKLYLLLTAYCYILGKPDFDCALFIDEGQEYYVNEYRLLAECTRATVNIYGDENQQLDPSRGVGSFDALNALWDMKRYMLNENYRNAQEITEFVNGELGMSVTSLGLSGGKVEGIAFSDLEREACAAMAAGDRIAVLYSPADALTAKKLAGMGALSRAVCTVKDSKGLEYERVYACGALTDREKYVAHTRALSELYIVE